MGIWKRNIHMDALDFLNKEGWQADEEFDVKVPHQGNAESVHVTVYNKERDLLYLAKLRNGNEVLVLPKDVDEATGNAIWTGLDVENFELAGRFGEAIERRDRG